MRNVFEQNTLKGNVRHRCWKRNNNFLRKRIPGLKGRKRKTMEKGTDATLTQLDSDFGLYASNEVSELQMT